MITVQEINNQSKKLGLAYEKLLQPLCKEFGMPHTAMTILLFLANNSDFSTAGDICDFRGLKRSIVSTHVERLVSSGYLERQAVPGDRRKDALVCTEKAETLIGLGQEKQKQFATDILTGLDAGELIVLERCFKIIGENVDKMIKENGNSKGEGEKIPVKNITEC